MNCTFNMNTGCTGAIANFGTSLTISDSTFTGNLAITIGGGIYNVNNSNTTVTGCTFIGNTADDGGAVYNDAANVIFADSMFCENTPNHISGVYDDSGGNEFCPLCDGDVNGDGTVGIMDFLDLLAVWGPCPAPPANCFADFGGDGTVGITDFLELLANWGACP